MIFLLNIKLSRLIFAREKKYLQIQYNLLLLIFQVTLQINLKKKVKKRTFLTCHN